MSLHRIFAWSPTHKLHRQKAKGGFTAVDWTDISFPTSVTMPQRILCWNLASILRVRSNSSLGCQSYMYGWNYSEDSCSIQQSNNYCPIRPNKGIIRIDTRMAFSPVSHPERFTFQSKYPHKRSFFHLLLVNRETAARSLLESFALWFIISSRFAKFL